MKTTINNKIISQRLSAPGIYLIHGYFGTGKTLLALKIACAVASGSKFLKWSASKPANVLFVNGEQSAFDLQTLVKAILADMNLENKSLPMWFITSLQPGEIDLSTRPWLEMLEKAVISDDIQLIVLNSVGTLCHSKQGKLKWWCLKRRDEGRAGNDPPWANDISLKISHIKGLLRETAHKQHLPKKYLNSGAFEKIFHSSWWI